MLSWLPENISTYGGDIDSLFSLIYHIVGTWFVAAELLLLYFVVRYRRRAGTPAAYVKGDSPRQLAWVLVPAAIFQILTGSVWQGVAILIVSFGVIFNIDNLLRPRLMGQQAGMHDLIVFFSTLDGLATFGAMGFVVGPIVAAFFLALLDLWADQHPPEAPATSAEGA